MQCAHACLQLRPSRKPQLVRFVYCKFAGNEKTETKFLCGGSCYRQTTEVIVLQKPSEETLIAMRLRVARVSHSILLPSTSLTPTQPRCLQHTLRPLHTTSPRRSILHTLCYIPPTSACSIKHVQRMMSRDMVRGQYSTHAPAAYKAVPLATINEYGIMK